MMIIHRQKSLKGSTIITSMSSMPQPNQVEAAVSGTAQSVDKVSVDDIEVEEGKKYVFAFANLKRIESDPIITDILKLTEGASAYGILSNDQTTQAVSFFCREGDESAFGGWNTPYPDECIDGFHRSICERERICEIGPIPNVCKNRIRVHEQI